MLNTYDTDTYGCMAQQLLVAGACVSSPRNEYKGLRLITPPGPAKSNSSGYSAEC